MRYEKSGRVIAVADTNILVSGLIGTGAASKLIVYFRAELFVLAVSPDVLKEYKLIFGVLRKVRKEHADALLESIRDLAIRVKLSHIPDICQDPSDNIFLACAEAAEADFLVTKNIRHFPKKSYKDVRIVRIGAFLRAIGK